ncbi:MAG TPA: STELLO glycosyltransferase family protein [Tepidisphaeraceae bacterium]|nr:STELLO glycosyltransferase family protein [Tepidisphaeraceae bacterium]
MIVVGDRKTPVNWACPGVTFISDHEQEKDRGRLARALPWNHYSRKMLGYACAIGAGASIIVDADDDNLPKPGWGFPPFDGTFDATADELGFVNVYSLFTDQRIWPRGFPLRRVNDPAGKLTRQQLTPAACRVGIWQALADGDPDVDAIYRLTDNQPCTFNPADPLVLGRGTLTPFNSQNTAFRKELFPLLYLPVTVSFRFTDILRSLVAQPVAWLAGFRVGITSATVVQERNPHDYLKDFESEIPCYVHTERVAQIVQATVSPHQHVVENLTAAYSELVNAGIVLPTEMDVLKAWIDLSCP